MTTRFKNAIDALVYAFFNDTLAKGTCTACAVGNIVAGAMGEKLDPEKVKKDTYFIIKGELNNNDWRLAFVTHDNHIQQRTDDELIPDSAKKVIALTGYSIDELAKVEHAFEINTTIWFDEITYSKEEIMQDQYKGLMAVVDVLCEIEGIEDPTEHKELFYYSQP